MIPASVTTLLKLSLATESLEKITILPGSPLTIDDMLRACGKDLLHKINIIGIAKMPRVKHKVINNLYELIGQDSDCTCPICFREFKESDRIIELPCCPNVYHYMHVHCFNNYRRDAFKNSGEIINNCPLCKKKYHTI